MSHLKYFNYPGYGDAEKDIYSQAVRIGDIIETSGQGGWDPNGSTNDAYTDLNKNYEQAFANVDITLKHAGGKGWSEVYKVMAYMTEINDDNVGLLVELLKKWCPNHRPCVTVIGVKSLAFKNAMIEVDVSAHSPQKA